MRRPRPWVIVPGIWNSDPDHWQSLWQDDRSADDPGAVVRIAPASWSEPDPDDWSRAITSAVAAVDEPPVLIAHSLGVLAVAAWLGQRGRAAVAGAFLVAPPDPLAPGFPAAAAGFVEPVAQAAPAVPTRLVVSDDDPYCTLDRAVAFADVLGAGVVRVGALGHVNVASGVGAWPTGRALVDDLERTL
ncbi:RBBP9/YdeN family alpha/beta hydrolase [Curtobacterium sp. YR515]|uniref:RBBP9/YdeN family alpha/beta hydrolase n=1 Tax=Curtobacterium sp. YR515 TaxID=1855316 RepID=UPI000B81FAE2|nr:alpha/beta fold hydrolase [Curtobacterium sp. YR515]